MVIATDNEDQQQVWYIFGRICYYLADVKPIEDAALDFDEGSRATMADVIVIFNKIMAMQ